MYDTKHTLSDILRIVFKSRHKWFSPSDMVFIEKSFFFGIGP